MSFDLIIFHFTIDELENISNAIPNIKIDSLNNSIDNESNNVFFFNNLTIIYQSVA